MILRDNEGPDTHGLQTVYRILTRVQWTWRPLYSAALLVCQDAPVIKCHDARSKNPRGEYKEVHLPRGRGAGRNIQGAEQLVTASTWVSDIQMQGMSAPVLKDYAIQSFHVFVTINFAAYKGQCGQDKTYCHEGSVNDFSHKIVIIIS